MKSRVSFLISKQVFEEFDSMTPHYKNSTIVNQIIKDYLEAGDYTEVKTIQRKDLIQVSFTIDFEVMEKFWKCYPVCRLNYRDEWDRPELSQSLEYLIKKYLEANRSETNEQIQS